MRVFNMPMSISQPLGRTTDGDTVYRELKERVKKLCVENEKHTGGLFLTLGYPLGDVDKSAEPLRIEETNPHPSCNNIDPLPKSTLQNADQTDADEIIYENWPIRPDKLQNSTEGKGMVDSQDINFLPPPLETSLKWHLPNALNRAKLDQQPENLHSITTHDKSEYSSPSSSDQASDSFSIGEDAKSYYRKREIKQNTENVLGVRQLTPVSTSAMGNYDPLFGSSKSHKVRMIDHSEKVALASIQVLSKVEAKVKMAVQKMAYLAAKTQSGTSINKAEESRNIPEFLNKEVSIHEDETLKQLSTPRTGEEMNLGDKILSLETINNPENDELTGNDGEDNVATYKPDNIVKRLSSFFVKETHQVKQFLDALGDNFQKPAENKDTDQEIEMTADKLYLNPKKTKKFNKKKNVPSETSRSKDAILQSLIYANQDKTHGVKDGSESDASWQTEWDEDGESGEFLFSTDVYVAPSKENIISPLSNQHHSSQILSGIKDIVIDASPNENFKSREPTLSMSPRSSVNSLNSSVTESKAKNLSSLSNIFSTLSFRNNKNGKISKELKVQNTTKAPGSLSDPFKLKLSQMFEQKIMLKNDNSQMRCVEENGLNFADRKLELDQSLKVKARKSLMVIPEADSLPISESLTNLPFSKDIYERKSCASSLNLTSCCNEPILIKPTNHTNCSIATSISSVPYESHSLYADHLNLSQNVKNHCTKGAKKRTSSFWNTINAFQGKKLNARNGKNKSLSQISYDDCAVEQRKVPPTFFFSPIDTLNAIGNRFKSEEKCHGPKSYSNLGPIPCPNDMSNGPGSPQHSYVNVPAYVNCVNHLGIYYPYYNILPGMAPPISNIISRSDYPAQDSFLGMDEFARFPHYHYIYDGNAMVRDNGEESVNASCHYKNPKELCQMFFHHYYNCQNCSANWPNKYSQNSNASMTPNYKESSMHSCPISPDLNKVSPETEKDSAISELSDSNSNNSNPNKSYTSRISDPQPIEQSSRPSFKIYKPCDVSNFKPHYLSRPVKPVDWKKVSEQAATLASKIHQFRRDERDINTDLRSLNGLATQQLKHPKLYNFANPDYINSISPPCITQIPHDLLPQRPKLSNANSTTPHNSIYDSCVPQKLESSLGPNDITKSQDFILMAPTSINSNNKSGKVPSSPRKSIGTSLRRHDRYRRSSRSSIGKMPFSTLYAAKHNGNATVSLASRSIGIDGTSITNFKEPSLLTANQMPPKPVQRKWFTVRTARKANNRSRKSRGNDGDGPMLLEDLFKVSHLLPCNTIRTCSRIDFPMGNESGHYHDPSNLSIGACSIGSGHSSAHSSSHSSKTFWHALPEVVNSLLLAKMSPQEIQLQEALYEIISSEKSYLKSLNILVDHFCQCPEFYSPRDSSKHGASILSQQEKHYLFSNITAVRDSSRRLVNDLGERWLQDGLVINDICDIMVNHCLAGEKGLEVYIKYCTNQSYQFRALKYLKEHNSSFLKVLKGLEQSEKCQGLSMYSYLILPMQRITRLPLLVKSVLDKRIADTLEYFNAQQALQLLNKIVSRCNSGARSMERVEQLIYIARNLKFKVKKIPMVSTARYLIKQGDLTCLSSLMNVSTPYSTGKDKIIKLKIHLILFNDLLLITKKKGSTYEVNDYCPKDFLDIRNVDDSDSIYALSTNIPCLPDRHLFVLVMLKNHENKFYQLTLECLTKCEKEDWIKALKNPEFQYENV